MTYSLQNQVSLASYSWAISFINVCSNSKFYAIKLWLIYWKVGVECDKSISAATTNLHQENPCMKSVIILVTILYSTICYLLY